MKIKKIVVGRLATNCYLVICEQSKESIVIDPGGEPDDIASYCKDNELVVKYIVNTHGHWDHIDANKELKKMTAASIMIHKDDANKLLEADANLSLYTGEECTSPEANILLQEGDIIEFGKESLQVLHTPGHSPGGISLLGPGLVFTGDALFAGSVGRTDLPGGSMEILIKTIRENLLNLPDETIVLPGHGPETTIGEEKRNNPFL